MKEPIFARIEIDLVDLVNKKNHSIKIILLILVFKVFDETIDKFWLGDKATFASKG